MYDGFFITDPELYDKVTGKNKDGFNLRQMRNICLVGTKLNGKYVKPNAIKIREKWYLKTADWNEFLNFTIRKGVCN